VREWLRSDGIFYVFLPNVASWEARLFQSYWYGLEVPRHLYHFSPESLRRLMASVGFVEECLATPPLNYVEQSTRYLLDDVLRSLGFPRQPLAVATPPGLLWKVMRKAVRITILSLFSRAASCTGSGPAIEAIFRKDAR
jgi:hypothetical protein